MFQALSNLIDNNQGVIATIIFGLLVCAFLFVSHRATRRDLEKFYKKYPKYDPRKKKKDSALWI